jgi:Ca-activated chloride channel family protein
MMPHFDSPWFLLLLLLLPLFAWLKGRHGAKPAFLYSSVHLVEPIHRASRTRVGNWQNALRWLSLALLIVALARPQKPEGESKISASGIDIVVAFDLSDSMAAEDFTRNGMPVDRVTIAREVLTKFVQNRPNDRIGLVGFSGKAYIVAPPTLDHDFLLKNLERLTIDTIPEEGTAIGSAISASLNRLRDLKSKSKIIILMTDGQNNTGKITPLSAADAAQALGIKIYAIGVGTHGIAQLPRKDAFGRKVYVPMNVDIDDQALTQIAERTGGKYYRADSTSTLQRIYSEIDTLEKTTAEVKKFQRYSELFRAFVAAGLAVLLLEILLAHTLWRKLP